MATTVCILASCSKTRDDNYGGNLRVQLHNCKTISDSTGEPQLCFDRVVEDSRCPSNKVCIWEGAAVGAFTFKVNSASYSFNMSTTRFPNRPTNDTIVAGYRIKFLELDPYPGDVVITSQPTAIMEVKKQ